MSETIAHDPRMQQDFGARMSLLVWWPIIEVVSDFDPRLTQLIRQEGKVFPDGSACLATTDGIRDVWTLLDEYGRSGFNFRYNTIFRSLFSFPPREYQLLTTIDYFTRIGSEQDFLVAPVRFCDAIAEGERTLDCIPVYVRFHRRPDRRVITLFESSLSNWAETLGKVDLGLVLRIDGSFSSRGRLCMFTIDARRGSQDTLNWLMLAILDFGAKVWPVAGVGFAHKS